MLFQAAAIVFAAFGILIKHPTAGVAIVLLALLHIRLPVLVALKWIADYTRLQAAYNLFQVTAKDAFKRASGQKHLLFAVAPGQHGRHIRAADASMAGLDEQWARCSNAQRAKCLIHQFLQHTADSFSTQR